MFANVCVLCADTYIFQRKWDQDPQHSNSQLAFFQLIIHSCSYNLWGETEAAHIEKCMGHNTSQKSMYDLEERNRYDLES